MQLMNDLFGGPATLALCFGLLLVAKLAKDWTTPYNIDRQLTQHDNFAVALSVTGYFAGTVIVLLGALIGPELPLGEDLLAIGGYGLLGILLLNASRWVNDKLILNRFCNTKELIDDRNAGTGAVEFGSYVASGLVVAGALHGEGSLVTAVLFFVVAQAALIVFARVYDWLMPFDVHAEIERDNVAAGVSFGGTLIALGIILFNGTVGNFVSWGYNLANFGLNAALGFVLLPLVRVAFDKIILARADLNREIRDDRNVGIGVLEMTIAISFAVLLVFTLNVEPLLQPLLVAG
ncbi:MAG: DUF350 domain-containing protein [Proteobacteria bacterium]|nr:DUF350 domain-containing protein [Pseudomonadota bacterium]